MRIILIGQASGPNSWQPGAVLDAFGACVVWFCRRVTNAPTARRLPTAATSGFPRMTPGGRDFRPDCRGTCSAITVPLVRVTARAALAIW
jgi:hypothetical protein